jgi:hypothetical protein
MITNMNAGKAEIRNRMDAIKQYMSFRKVFTEIKKIKKCITRIVFPFAIFL